MAAALRIAALGLLCALCASLLRQLGSPAAMAVRLGAAVCLAAAVLQGLGDTFGILRQFWQQCGIPPEYLTRLFKALGVCWVGECAANLCADLQESALAGQVQLGVRVALLTLAAPVLADVCTMLLGAMEGT